MEYRTESDSLGNKDVPAEAYYGIQTLRASENFPITGYKIHRELIISLALVKEAAARVNMDVGILGERIGNAIVQACQEIQQGRFHDEIIVDPIQGGAGTSLNMNINEVIANCSLEMIGKDKGDYHLIHPNNHVNMGQSTNDVLPTAFRLAAIRLLDRVIESFKNLHSTLQAKAEEFDDVLKMGRTHLQDAIPIRLGQEFSAYAATVERSIARFENRRDYLRVVNIGATAVGTGLNADQEYVKKITDKLREISGYDLVQADNLVDATQNTDVLVDVSTSLKTAVISLSKMANDLRLMSSGPRAGFNEIELPSAQPGSSIMPGKVNPVIAEVINQVAFQIQGNDQTIALAAEAGQLELNVMVPVLVFNLIQSLDILKNAVDVFTQKCIKGIQANRGRCSYLVDRSVGIITAINPHIGYEEASRIAKRAIETDRPVRDLILEEGIMTKEELDQVLNPYEMTEPGISGRDLMLKKQNMEDAELA
ncbi:MAG: aspartate ammonia-lyase [Halanaerobium sp.]|nr:aspartate ammonia-lyase [Halanaerobium sp.]